MLEALLPLALSLALDLGTTEWALASTPCRSVACGDVWIREGNPMPGMQSFGGRIAWGGVELAGVFLIHKLDSRVGRIVAWVFSAVHVALAIHNVSTGRGLRRHLAVSVSF